LALQGGVAPHLLALAALGHQAVEVRDAAGLSQVAGLVLPGGESTTQLRLIERFGLEAGLRDFWAKGAPILATCAGLVLCASQVTNPVQRGLGLLDVAVARNGWGPQVESFEEEGEGDYAGMPLVFIRAPRILSVGPSVRVLAVHGGEPVLVRAGRLWAATFHPELTLDRRVHREVFGPAAAEPAGCFRRTSDLMIPCQDG
jgi:5'-phosphate synthase pdxT subunit